VFSSAIRKEFDVLVIKKDFCFNGTDASYFNLITTAIDSPADSNESVWSELEITTNISSRGDIIETGVKHDPAPVFEMDLINEKGQTISDEQFEAIAIWLQPDSHAHWLEIQEFDLDVKCYLCYVTSISRRIIAGELKSIGVTWQSKSRWAMSELIKSEFDVTSNTQDISVYNNSSSPFIYPLIHIAPTDANISFQNLSNGEPLVRLSSLDKLKLSNGQHVVLDNENQMIYLDSIDKNQLMSPHFNWTWFRLRRGENNIQITGRCKIDFIYREQRMGGLP